MYNKNNSGINLHLRSRSLLATASLYNLPPSGLVLGKTCRKRAKMKRFILILARIGVLAFLSACSPQAPATQTLIVVPTACVAPAITLGEIGEQPSQIVPDTQKLANYLAQKLASFGIECGQVKVTSTVKDMIELINQGEVDVYLDSMFPATLVSDATGAEPILRQWRNCDPEYYSVLFTLVNSGIASIDDLPGHVIGVDRPDSTSGFVMPASYLIDRGLHMEVKANWNEPVDADEVGVWFTGADDNTRTNVASGNVVAGATDDFNYDEWEKEEPGKFLVLAKTGSEPRRAVLVRAGLDSALKAAIKDVLLKADQDPNALAVLKDFQDTCRFDDMPAGIQAAFDQMRVMYEKVKQVSGWSPY